MDSKKESQRADCIRQGTMEQSVKSINKHEIKPSSLVRQQEIYQDSINTDRGRKKRGNQSINQSIKTILYQKHEVRPRLISVSRLNYLSVPAQFSLLFSVFIICYSYSRVFSSHCLQFQLLFIIVLSCYCYKEARDPFFV